MWQSVGVTPAASPRRIGATDSKTRAQLLDAAELVLLDADQPDGYLRQWQPPGFPPLRHTAYAVQWFGLALALGIIYLVTNVRRPEA